MIQHTITLDSAIYGEALKGKPAIILFGHIKAVAIYDVPVLVSEFKFNFLILQPEH